MTSIQKKRLGRYINFLRKIPKSNFNMNHWILTDAETSKQIICDLKRHKCGTAGCAVGWMPVFNPKAFQYKSQFNQVSLVGDKTRFNVDAAIEYFGINRNVALQIFYLMGKDGSYGYPENDYNKWTNDRFINTSKITPKMVASRLAKYLKRVKAGVDINA